MFRISHYLLVAFFVVTPVCHYYIWNLKSVPECGRPIDHRLELKDTKFETENVGQVSVLHLGGSISV